jgi:hypothetical protein
VVAARVSVAKPKTKAERLFSAAVVRRSFELQDRDYEAGFRFVYEGVLRDLELEDSEVEAYLAEHRAEVEAAIGRRSRGGGKK